MPPITHNLDPISGVVSSGVTWHLWAADDGYYWSDSDLDVWHGPHVDLDDAFDNIP